MQQFMTAIYNMVTAWQPYVWVVALAVLMVDGIMIMMPFQDIKDKGKRALPALAIGCGIALGAVILAKEITGYFSFKG